MHLVEVSANPLVTSSSAETRPVALIGVACRDAPRHLERHLLQGEFLGGLVGRSAAVRGTQVCFIETACGKRT